MTISRTKLEADDSLGPMKAVNEQTPGIDEVAQGIDYRKLFSEEAFMNEYVTIFLHPGQDSSEVGVPVSVNGNRVYIVPGRPQKVKRFHVYQLVKARPDVIIHRSDDYNAPESELNRMFKQNTSRYNFDVLEDTPKGIAWLKELRHHHQKK